MKTIQLQCDIPEPPFEVERYEYRNAREGEVYLYRPESICRFWDKKIHNYIKEMVLVAIPKKKPEYQWPEFFADGAELYQDDIMGWVFRKQDGSDSAYVLFYQLHQIIPFLPLVPPCEPGTVFVKKSKYETFSLNSPYNSIGNSCGHNISDSGCLGSMEKTSK